ncbi:hypothetical protein [Paenibacillus gansuensis]|uniref:Phosphodiester glycosidase domain-containing protein n=1 Tax=Paenibacillus gansuensis TaxID=306542 RepID=A0ABW5PE61_9BACL
MLIAALAFSLPGFRTGEPAPPFPDPPTAYTYREVRASNGVVLHTMKTSPRNVRLEAVSTNVLETRRYGINGGFFYNGDLLSIAVQNDRPVTRERGAFGSGWTNVKYSRGTLVWDGAARAWSVQQAASAGELAVSDRSEYWAQGGISMSLRDEARWAEQAAKEAMPFAADRRMRTGLVYNTGLNVWFIVSPVPCTAAEFRSAILETVGSGTLVDGIFLDGDGSSQMQCTEVQLPGDSRSVYQMLTLIN